MPLCPLQYGGTIKHKRWKPGGGFGTLCPRWTHQAHSQGFAGDPRHPWEKTQAHAMDVRGEHAGRQRTAHATGKGIALVAVNSGDGTRHGYPVPWQDVPKNNRDAFVRDGRLTRRQTRRTVERDDIRWALESDDGPHWRGAEGAAA